MTSETCLGAAAEPTPAASAAARAATSRAIGRLRFMATPFLVRHRRVDAADVEQSYLALVDGRESVGDEGVEAALVDLDVEHAAAAGRHGRCLDVVQRVRGVHVR